MAVNPVRPFAPSTPAARDPRPRASLTIIEGTIDAMDHLQILLAQAQQAAITARHQHRDAHAELTAMAEQLADQRALTTRLAERLRHPAAA